jgi:hypothetical protein
MPPPPPPPYRARAHLVFSVGLPGATLLLPVWTSSLVQREQATTTSASRGTGAGRRRGTAGRHAEHGAARAGWGRRQSAARRGRRQRRGLQDLAPLPRRRWGARHGPSGAARQGISPFRVLRDLPSVSLARYRRPPASPSPLLAAVAVRSHSGRSSGDLRPPPQLTAGILGHPLLARPSSPAGHPRSLSPAAAPPATRSLGIGARRALRWAPAPRPRFTVDLDARLIWRIRKPTELLGMLSSTPVRGFLP